MNGDAIRVVALERYIATLEKEALQAPEREARGLLAEALAARARQLQIAAGA